MGMFEFLFWMTVFGWLAGSIALFVMGVDKEDPEEGDKLLHVAWIWFRNVGILLAIAVVLFKLVIPNLFSVARAAECRYVGEQCIEGPATRDINGIPVTRQCWKYQVQYACYARENAIQEDPQCQALRERGCGQIASRCIETEASSGLCIRYEQSYSCPEDGARQATVECGGETLCQGGSCASMAYDENQGFGQSAALIETLGEISRELESDRFTIFKGTPSSCDKQEILNFRDCCKVSGWGYDTGLADCSFQEKNLSQQRAARKCHYIGEYCAETFKPFGRFGPTWCIRKRQSFCCYGSKLARIIAEQARIQLGRGWGTAERPDCRGFSVEQEITRLDFSAMDLSEFYQDVLDQNPGLDPARTRNRIEQAIQGAAQ